MFNNNNPIALQKELEGLSKVMGRKDIQTTFQGEGAWADGKNVNIPEMDVDAQLSPDEMATLRGYHIHEVAHITETDYDLWRGKKSVTKEKRATWNAMEDVFIERRAQEQYAGARRNLEATCNTVLGRENEIDSQLRALGEDPYAKWWESIDYAALQLSRQRMGYESPALDEYVSNLPAKLRKEAEKFVGDALDANSTEDTFRLATKIRRRMGKLNKDNEGDDGSSGTQRQQQQGQQSGDAQGQGQGKSQEQGDEQGQGDAQGQGDDAQPHGQEQQGTSTQDRMERAEGVAEDISGKHRTHEVGRTDRRMAKTFVGYMEFHEYIVEQVMKHPNMKPLAQRCISNWSRPTWGSDYSVLLEMMKSDTSARQYSARLARLLLAREDKRFVGGQLDGRVDRRRLAQLVAGQRNVFTHQETLRTDDTIVTVAVDASASMEMFKTRKALALLNECLGKANVDYEILSWTGYNRAFLQTNFGGKPCPFNSNGLVELKNITQRGNNPQVRKNIANYLEQDGWTPTFAAMQAVAQRSVKQSQTRRIVLFLTDGDPDGSRLEQLEVGKVVRAMTKVGIETIGVGIGKYLSQKGMARMFGASKIAVSDEGELGVSLLGQIETLLVGRAHEAA
jgi:hypothetical protein